MYRIYRWFVTNIVNRRWGSTFIRLVYQPLDRATYRLSGGRRGLSPAREVLLLISTGRKSGLPRQNPLMFLEHEGSFWVMGSNFGQDHHPSWTANLMARPQATVQIGHRTHTVTARLASDQERRALWPRLVEVYPPWNAYTDWTDRSFRLFELRPERSARGG